MILALVMQRPFSGGGSSHSRIRIRLGMVGIKTQQAGEEGMPSGLRPSWSGGSRGWIMQGLGYIGAWSASLLPDTPLSLSLHGEKHCQESPLKVDSLTAPF